MKKFFKSWFINSVSLALVAWLYNGLEVSFQLNDFFLLTLALTLIIKIIRPVFELIFLPINLLTLGFFRWIRTVISLGLVIYLIEGVKLKEFYFPGLKLNGVEIRSFTTPPFISLITAAFFLNFCKKAIYWLFKTK